MANNKEQYISIQNLKRWVENEINKLELERSEKHNYLNCLSKEILNLNNYKLEPFSRVRSD